MKKVLLVLLVGVSFSPAFGKTLNERFQCDAKRQFSRLTARFEGGAAKSYVVLGGVDARKTGVALGLKSMRASDLLRLEFDSKRCRVSSSLLAVMSCQSSNFGKPLAVKASVVDRDGTFIESVELSYAAVEITHVARTRAGTPGADIAQVVNEFSFYGITTAQKETSTRLSFQPDECSTYF